MKRITLAILAAIIPLGLISCSKNEGDIAETVTESVSVSTSTIATETTVTETTVVTEVPPIEFFKTDEEMYEINSKHCSVQYPVKWQNMVEIQVEETESSYSLCFYALFEQNKIHLYTFVFGDCDTGYLLGMVNTEKGEQNLYLIDSVDDYNSVLSESEKEIYREMSEGVNHIISKLVYDNGMIIP